MGLGTHAWVSVIDKGEFPEGIKIRLKKIRKQVNYLKIIGNVCWKYYSLVENII